MDRLEAEIKRSASQEDLFSFILCGIDLFKKVNDTYGHPAGDKVLKEVAATIRETIRTTDFPGRYGGEEFGIVLPDTELEGAVMLAEKLRSKVMITSIRVEEKDPLSVTLSLGVSVWSAKDNASNLIKKADEHLYAAKQGGRNRVVSDVAVGAEKQ